MTNLTEQYRELEQDFFAYQKMLNEANKDLNKYYLENTELKEELQNQAFILKSRESEIVKLKELLKRCKRIIEIDEYVSITGAGRDILWDLLQDLKQVLGEE